MNKEANPGPKVKTGVYHAPWEMSFDKILTPFEEFIHRQTTSGILLMCMAVLALVRANGPLASAYENVVHTLISLNIGGWALEMTLHQWINDGLMALFFFVVGLELKRELLVGDQTEKDRLDHLPVGTRFLEGRVRRRWLDGGYPWPPISLSPLASWPCWRVGCPRP